MYAFLPAVLATGTTTNPFSSVDFSTIVTYAETIAPQAVVPIITVLALVIGMRLIKRFGSMIG